MPGRDGTGPRDQSQRRGRGQGQGGRFGGPGGKCLCPVCNHTVPHILGQPCNQMNCPKCGVSMVRV